MLTILSALVSVLFCRFRGRSSLELEVVALRHQLAVLRRQHPGRPRIGAWDRLLWALLYRLWPQCLEVMVLVKPATVIQGIERASGSTGGGDRDPAVSVGRASIAKSGL